MLLKQIIGLFLWCHCSHIVLNPLLQIIALTFGSESTFRHFTNSNGGQTQLNFNGLYVFGSPITVAAKRVTLTPGQEIALKCEIIEYPEAQFSWYRVRKYSNNIEPQLRGMEEREELEQSDDRFIINNNNIIIKSSTLADVGDYYCKVKEPRDTMETEKMISVRPRPYIHDFELESSTYKSATIEEGKPLKLTCNVADDYAPESNISVSWHMSKYDENDMDDVLSGEDGIKIEVYNTTSKALIIDNVTKDHRRIYKCQVTNGVTENSKTILIRVKDKYTAIWPAVGIFIELVMLIGVICAVENRKVEPDKDAYDLKAIQM